MNAQAPMPRVLIFDFIRTLYDPVGANLYSGVRSMLQDLKENCGRHLLIYSRRDKSRAELVEEQGIQDYFDGIYFVDQKNPESLGEILKKHNIAAKAAVVIGDMLDAELCAASELGADTVWVRGHESIQGEPTCIPTHTVDSIAELHKLLKEIA